MLGISGLAGWLAIDHRARMRDGETVLVLGAGGVVGQVAVQAAKLLGAGRVVAAARSQERLDRAVQQGADATVQIGAVDDLAEAFREAGGGGVDVVVDPVWGEPAVAALGGDERAGPPRAARAVGGRGGDRAVGADARQDPRRARHDHLRGAAGGQARAYETMAEHANAGRLEVEVERIPLDGVAEAWKRQTSSPGVKLVVEP